MVEVGAEELEPETEPPEDGAAPSSGKVEVAATPEVANGTSPVVPFDWIRITSV